MKYNELNVDRKKSSIRAGRGISAGRGKTAGRGTKGQSSRTGGKVRPGFEGGQNPLYMRLPKLPGFTSKRKPAENVSTSQINSLKVKNINNEVLLKAGLVSSQYSRVKLIFDEEINREVSVELQGASQNSVASIQKKGGSFKQIDQVKRPKTSKKSS